MTGVAVDAGLAALDFGCVPPSPLQPAPRLAASLGVAELCVKRDDLIGFAGGGTKCRKLAGLLQRLRASGADTFLLSGGAMSNQVRIIAALAAVSGHACEVFIDATEAAPAARFGRFFGARIHALPDATHWTLNAAIRGRLRELTAAGQRAVVIPAASHEDLAAYAQAIGELVAQGVPASPRRTLIVTAAGSGATSAGFLLGLERHLTTARLLSISADRRSGELRTIITRLLASATGADPEGDDIGRLLARLDVDDRAIGGGYGARTEDADAAIALAARSEGLLMEPVYTGKALAALCAMSREGSIDRDDRIVFWHTGGVPYLASALAQPLPPD
ncbi:MAG TPA: pyridoxal-phosphate dependent enzyme [Dokdonella sp.]